jgi:hypothetical protein
MHRNRKLKRIILSALSVAFISLLAAYILSGHDRALRILPVTPFIALSGLPVPEIPARAADLVHAAAPSGREQTARDVLLAVATLARPGVLPYVVSAICHTNPEVAGITVATAIELQPGDVLIFSKAAVCAAPARAEQITFSACQAAPRSFANVVLVIFRQAPSARDSILRGLINALPGLETYLEAAALQTGTDELEPVIKQTVRLLTDANKVNKK